MHACRPGQHSVVKARRSSSGRCDLSDFCRKFLPHSSGFPAAFSLIFLIFLTHCVAETHLVLPCAQVHVMRCLMSSAMVVVWIVAGAAQKLSINSTKQQTAALLPPCPPCRPAGQGASPCARVRAMQPAKALYYVVQSYYISDLGLEILTWAVFTGAPTA